MMKEPFIPNLGKDPEASSEKPQKADSEPEDDEEEEPSTIRQALY
jgi:hypothetical protein